MSPLVERLIEQFHYMLETLHHMMYVPLLIYLVMSNPLSKELTVLKPIHSNVIYINLSVCVKIITMLLYAYKRILAL